MCRTYSDFAIKNPETRKAAFLFSLKIVVFGDGWPPG